MSPDEPRSAWHRPLVALLAVVAIIIVVVVILVLLATNTLTPA